MKGGEGPIIIHGMISNPAVKIEQKRELQLILERYKVKGKLSLSDRIYVASIAWGLIK